MSWTVTSSVPVVLRALVAVALIAPGSASAQWSRVWGGDGLDQAFAVARDAAGNIVVAGTTNQGAGGRDLVVQKYGPDGSLTWVRTWGGSADDQALGIVVSADDSIYVTGQTLSFGAGWSDILLLKYSADGTLVWARTWGSGTWEISYDLAIDDSGNVRVAGETYGAGTAAVMLTFDPLGSLLAASAWKGTDTYDTAHASRFDAGGNQYVLMMGWDYSAGYDTNLILAKYGPSGDHLWSRKWNGPSFEDVYGESQLSVRPDGTMFIAASTASVGAGGYDVLLLKVDSDGNELWAKTWGGNGDDFGHSVAVLPDGKLLVTGDTSSFGGRRGFELGADSSTGELLGARVWDGPDSGFWGMDNISAPAIAVGWTTGTSAGWTPATGSFGPATIPNYEINPSLYPVSLAVQSPTGTETTGGIPPLGSDVNLLLAALGGWFESPPCEPATIQVHPSDQTVTIDESATLVVIAAGTSPLSYQWYLGSAGDTSVPIAGASGPTYTTASLSSAMQFWVRVSNDCGDVMSATASVSVVAPARIDTWIVKDANGNGAADPDETLLHDPGLVCLGPGLNGLSVALSGPENVRASNVCPSGWPVYRADNLLPGVYSVSLGVPPDWQSTGSTALQISVTEGDRADAVFFITRTAPPVRVYIAGGDSVAAGQDIDLQPQNKLAAYPQLVKDDLQIDLSDYSDVCRTSIFDSYPAQDPATFFNISVPGQSSTDFLGDQRRLIEACQPDLVSITIGANDLLQPVRACLLDGFSTSRWILQIPIDFRLRWVFYLTAVLGSIEGCLLGTLPQLDEFLNIADSNLEVITTRLQTFTDAKVLFTNYYNPFPDWDFLGTMINALNSKILHRAIAMAPRAAVVDISAAFDGHALESACPYIAPFAEAPFLRLGIHPNRIGQQVIASQVARTARMQEFIDPTSRSRPFIACVGASSARLTGGETVVLDGADFAAGGVLLVDGITAQVTSVSDDGLHATFVTPAGTSTGAVDLVWFNPDGGYVRLPGALTYR